ncbi:MAG: hypothetical protein QOG43_1544 [Actinomycetota bacterium]|jgi:hypothetical protein|nr:hypothetical protein [Actinomycetota bacterium]
MSARTRICRSLVMVAVAATTLAVPASASAASAAPSCAVTWGSLTRAHASTVTAPLDLVRTGRHSCYDRVVFEFEGPMDGYRVDYVDQVRTEPDGWVLPVTGGARLQVTLVATVIDETGRWTYSPPSSSQVVDVTGYRTLRQVALGGTNNIGHPSEWHTTFGIGVRARLPFQAFVLPGPGTHSRLVIDVAHRW